MTIDVFLYGRMARYGEATGYGYANVKIELAAGGTMKDLLGWLKLPTEERGITFINGNLSAMPGLQPDLDTVLNDGDRVAFFDQTSMWPFQYRNGAAMTDEMQKALAKEKDQGLHHSYEN
jgi:hypothetical protein